MPGLPFQLELTHPAWLAGLALLLLLAWYFHRSLADFPRWQKVLSLVCRSAIAVLLVLSLCGLTLLKPTHEQYVVFAVDKSLSVGTESDATVTSFLDRALQNPGANRTAFVSFASQPGAVTEDRAALPTDLDTKGTNLAAAIEAAAGAIPPQYVPGIVIFSDGNQTEGDAVKAALQAGLAVSTVPLPTRPDPEVQVSAVNVPAQVREGEPFYVEVVIDANQEQEGTIEVFRGAHKVVGSPGTELEFAL